MSAEKIRALNDAFRKTMTGGQVMLTAGVDALPSDVKAMVIRRVATFSNKPKSVSSRPKADKNVPSVPDTYRRSRADKNSR